MEDFDFIFYMKGESLDGTDFSKRKDNPRLSELIESIKCVIAGSGTVSLTSLARSSMVKIRSLTLVTNNDRYMLFCVKTPGDEPEKSMVFWPDVDAQYTGSVQFGEDKVDARCIFKDSEIILPMFQNYFESGWVGDDCWRNFRKL